MRSLLLLVSLFFSTTALASQNQYRIDINLTINNEKVVQAVITTLEGQPATVNSIGSSDETFLSITPLKGEYSGEEIIELSMVIGKLYADGTEKILSQPGIWIESGQQGTILISEEGGDEIYIEVTATKL